jgi:phage-related holin
MSLELINNLLELSEKHMNEGEYNQVAMLLKEKYKIIDDVDYETMLIVPPIEFSTHLEIHDIKSLFTVKAFKYKKDMKNELRSRGSRYISGEFLFQVGEQEHYIKSQSIYNFISTIIQNDLLKYLSIKNSFYGELKEFNTLNYLSFYLEIDTIFTDENELDNCIFFNSYVYDKLAKTCENTIRETILLLFSKM